MYSQVVDAISQPACTPEDHRSPNHITQDHRTQDHRAASPSRTLVPEAALERCARIFRAMGDTSRLRLLTRLADGPACVGELAEAEGESITTISQRLRVLRADNIVRGKRDGKHILYSLADQHMLDLVRNGLAHAAERPPASPDSL